MDSMATSSVPAGKALKTVSERLGRTHRVTMSFPWV